MYMDNPLVEKEDVVSHMSEFVGEDEHLFFILVCRVWHDKWSLHHNHTVTRAVTADTTVSQLQFSIDHALCRTTKVCKAIAELGRLDLLKCARQNGLPWDKGTCSAAASGGHYDVLTWAWVHSCPFDEDTLCSDAASGGNIDALVWAIELGYLVPPTLPGRGI